MVCLQADEETMGYVVDAFFDESGQKPIPFIDDDYPENFGWTAVAFHPITKEKGDQYFKRLRLA